MAEVYASSSLAYKLLWMYSNKLTTNYGAVFIVVTGRGVASLIDISDTPPSFKFYYVYTLHFSTLKYWGFEVENLYFWIKKFIFNRKKAFRRINNSTTGKKEKNLSIWFFFFFFFEDWIYDYKRIKKSALYAKKSPLALSGWFQTDAQWVKSGQNSVDTAFLNRFQWIFFKNTQ